MENRKRHSSVASTCDGDATIDFRGCDKQETSTMTDDSPAKTQHHMVYGVNDVAPWYLNIVFAFQVCVFPLVSCHTGVRVSSNAAEAFSVYILSEVFCS